MSDYAVLKITKLNIKTHIGVFNWEQVIKQTILIDLEFKIDLDKVNEDLSSTINYAAVSELLTKKITDAKFSLIENLAKYIRQIIMENFAIAPTVIRVHKPNALTNATGVCLEILG